MDNEIISIELNHPLIRFYHTHWICQFFPFRILLYPSKEFIKGCSYELSDISVCDDLFHPPNLVNLFPFLYSSFLVKFIYCIMLYLWKVIMKCIWRLKLPKVGTLGINLLKKWNLKEKQQEWSLFSKVVKWTKKVVYNQSVPHILTPCKSFR